ncbi:ABC transporter permease [Tautonia rosea]|uniref:ABC transporter permease n=1 Tax=Tautonia rosea TaxID=2728037 RepID=UPI0014750DA5|nr:ABC transporter permease subunit [Tautonia rosea]
MARRIGLGPVFAFEWLMTSRRWQAYAMRSLTVLILLAAMTLVWFESYAGRSGGRELSIRQQAQVGQAFFGTTAMILLGLVGLAAPAATAGSICLDKARGNLTLLFATDLSNTEIVLGKLAARLVPVLGLILCAAPVLAIGTLFGGIDPVGLIGSLLVILAVAIFGCSLALALSIWGRKTHEVLIATYVFGILYLMAAPISLGLFELVPRNWRWTQMNVFEELLRFNPVFLVLSTIETPPIMRPVTFGTNVQFLGLGLAASAGLMGLSIWRLRSVVVGQLGKVERGGTRRRSIRSHLTGAIESDRFARVAPGTARVSRWIRGAWPAPSLDRNPVYWRECQRKRPSRLDLISWSIYILFCGGFSLSAIFLMLSGENWGAGMGVFVNVVQVPLGLLLLSVSAATSLSEERQRGSLDVLLVTPMSTRSIVWGKWCGAFRSVPPLLILPIGVALALSTESGHVWAVALLAALILAYGAAITSLGLALATWTNRMGRAVGLTTGIYVFVSIAWPFLAMLLFGNRAENLGLGIASASPFFGVGAYSALIADEGPRSAFASQTFWVLFWTMANLGIAGGLLLVTVQSFNPCLGRIDDPTEGFGGELEDEPIIPANPRAETGSARTIGVQHIADSVGPRE